MTAKRLDQRFNRAELAEIDRKRMKLLWMVVQYLPAKCIAELETVQHCELPYLFSNTAK